MNRSITTAFLLSLITATACSGSDPEGNIEAELAARAGLQGARDTKPTLSTPTISIVGATQTSIDVQVCAGDTGAPAGFSVQWMSGDAYNAGGWSSDDPSYCGASFSGVPAQSVFSLDPGECSTVTIGALDLGQVGVSTGDGCNDGLTCGTEYAFRAFAHGNSDSHRSPFTDPVLGSTLACDESGESCTFTQGYWKTHDGSPNADVWPVSSLTLGSVAYDQAELSAILDTAVKGNGLTALTHQLIAAKLNIASGADPSAISSSVDAADALIGGLVAPPVGSDYLSTASTSALVGELASYNEGTTGPGHCDDGGVLVPLPGRISR
jgi:hypothetical protein